MSLFWRMRNKGKKSVKVEATSEKIKKMGARIKSLRIQQGYANYDAFAFEHKIHRSQYGRYEKGEDLKFSSLLKVINALGITLEEFFSEGFD